MDITPDSIIPAEYQSLLNKDVRDEIVARCTLCLTEINGAPSAQAAFHRVTDLFKDDSFEKLLVGENVMAVRESICAVLGKSVFESKPLKRGFWTELVRSFNTPEEFLVMFRSMGIDGKQWRNSEWLSNKTKLSKEDGGIGKSLNGLCQAIRGDSRFKDKKQPWQAFLDFMDAKEYVPSEPRWVGRIKACVTSEDFLKLFQNEEIPGDKWRSNEWLMNKAKLTEKGGGIGKILGGLASAIRRDARFKDKKQPWQAFLDFMDRKEYVPSGPTWVDRVKTCEKPEDFLKLFQSEGIPGDKWRISSWLLNIAKLSKEDGGIGKNLCGLQRAITGDSRFKDKEQSWQAFLDFMDEKEYVPSGSTWVERVKACVTSEDFLKLFQNEEIPGDKWRNTRWLSTEAKLSIEEGGIGKTLGGLLNSITLDSRFKEKEQPWQAFLDFMDGKEYVPSGPTWRDRIKACEEPKDFLKLFKSEGVLDDKWRSSEWLKNKAKLSKEKGGIEKSLKGLQRAIRRDSRFKDKKQPWQAFLDFMDGKEYIPSGSTWVERVKACKTSEDFLKLFQSEGIPEDKWRSTGWLTNNAKLTQEKGGIGKILAGLQSAITHDSRFKHYTSPWQAFLDFMDRKVKQGRDERIFTEDEMREILERVGEKLGKVPSEVKLGDDSESDEVLEYIQKFVD